MTRFNAFIALAAVLLATSAARHASAELTWVARQDAMFHHRLADQDRPDGRVRLLYATLPSRDQSRAPDKAIHVYVAELHPDGRIENHQVTSGDRHFSTLLLQRGGDGVFLVPDRGSTVGEITLETWSIREGRRRSSVTPAALAGAGGAQSRVYPTDDGNLFTVRSTARPARGDPPNTLTWTRLAPNGQVLAQGDWHDPTAVTTVASAFPARQGRIGLALVSRLADGAESLASELDVQSFEVGGRTLQARVFSETFLIVTDGSGQVDWRTSALSRDLLWAGDVAIPQDLPVDDIMAQSREQMALMSRVSIDSMGERSILDQASWRHHDIQRTPSGYGLLLHLAADRDLVPPRHGTWFIEIGDDGTLIRELRLEAAAERLKARFSRFQPTPDGGLLVAGTRRDGDSFLHLTALDAQGEIVWTTRLEANNTHLDGVAGSAEAPWVFGNGIDPAGNRQLLWMERVDPGAGLSIPATNAESPVAPVPSHGPVAESTPVTESSPPRSARRFAGLRLQLRGARADQEPVRSAQGRQPGDPAGDGQRPGLPGPDELHSRLRHEVRRLPLIACRLPVPVNG